MMFPEKISVFFDFKKNHIQFSTLSTCWHGLWCHGSRFCRISVPTFPPRQILELSAMALLTAAARLLGAKNASCLVLAARHASTPSMNLKDILTNLIPKEQARIKAFRQQHGKRVVGQITVDMMYGGMRGMRDLYMKHQFLNLMRASVSEVIVSPNARNYCLRLRVGKNPFLRAYFGCW